MTEDDKPTLREFRAVSVAVDTFFEQVGEQRSHDTADLERLITAATKVAAVVDGTTVPHRGVGFGAGLGPLPQPSPPP